MTPISPINVIQLICFSFLMTGGQILFKIVATALPPLTSMAGILGLFSNIFFWFALVLYGAATFLWIMILQQIQLSLAYPFVALGFILIPAASWLLFQESINWLYFFGVILIIAGLGVITTMATK